MPSPCAPSRAIVETRAHWALTPASRNSRLPSPPSIGDGQSPAPANRASRPASRAAPRRCARRRPGSRNTSALADRSAAGLELRLDQKHGASTRRRSESAGGRASFIEMKLTSQTMKSGDCPRDARPSGRARSSLRSGVTRGSAGERRRRTGRGRHRWPSRVPRRAPAALA